MTQENKQLLLKDLCARLSYSVFGFHRGEDLPLYAIDDSGAYMVLGYDAWFDLDTIPFKPYLRPMDSMTEKELFKFIQISDSILRIGEKKLTCILSLEQMDWLNAHYFDYRGLIAMGLALEAPEGMYKTEFGTDWFKE